MTAQAQVEAIIAQALTTATQKAEEATKFSNSAQTAAGASAGGIRPANVPVPDGWNALEPSVYIPNKATGLDTALFDSSYKRIFDDLVGNFAKFFAEYFPANCDYITKAQNWLCDVLQGKTGIPTAVEDQIWQRERSRLLTEASRADDELIETFAARGFPLPPGALLHQRHLLQQDLQNRTAQSSRDTAIKQWEIINENMKFAVQQALEYRIKAIQAAGDYIRALALGPQLATQLATSSSDAQARLISAAAGYYNARISVGELQLKARMFNASEANDAGKVSLQEFSNRLKAQTETLSAAARAAGDQAAAALNAVHASASIAVQGETA